MSTMTKPWLKVLKVVVVIQDYKTENGWNPRWTAASLQQICSPKKKKKQSVGGEHRIDRQTILTIAEKSDDDRDDDDDDYHHGDEEERIKKTVNENTVSVRSKPPTKEVMYKKWM